MPTTSHVTLIRVQELNPASNKRNVITVPRSVGQADTSRYISDMSHDLKCALFVGAAVCVGRSWRQNNPSTARAFGAACEKRGRQRVLSDLGGRIFFDVFIWKF